MLYSDSTNLAGNGNKSGWPIVMSLGNISLEHRKKTGGHKLLGMLPHLPKEMDSGLKIEVFNKCLQNILGPLKRLSYEGIVYQDLKLFPFLYSYVHDYPEGCKVISFFTVSVTYLLYTFSVLFFVLSINNCLRLGVSYIKWLASKLPLQQLLCAKR